MGSEVRLAVAVTTVGRWAALQRLLDSLDASTHPPAAVAVANQSGGPVPPTLRHRDGTVFVDSGGGASRGRNDALGELRGRADLIAFPNDHSSFAPTVLAEACRTFVEAGRPGALIGTLVEPGGVRMAVPPPGTPLNAFTVWRAIEPTMFVAAGLAERLGFREDLGTGSGTPWQAGEGTDLLLRIMAEGHPVLAAPQLTVHGDGERRSLSPGEWRVKLRSYARGTGYVMRLHRAGLGASTVHVLVPWYRFLRPFPGRRTPAADCLQGSIGRLEGRIGRCLSHPERRLGSEALRK